MRGDKIIGGAGVQSATVFAGRVGPQAFRLRNRWTHALTLELAAVSTVWGYRADVGYPTGPFGNLQPSVWSGLEIAQLGVTENDFVVVEFQSFPGVQVPGVDELIVCVAGWRPIVVTWDSGRDDYTATSPGAGAHAAANAGGTLGVRISKQS